MGTSQSYEQNVVSHGVGGGTGVVVDVGPHVPDTTTLTLGSDGESGGLGIEQTHPSLHVAVISHTSSFVFHVHSHFGPHGFFAQVYVLELEIDGSAGSAVGIGGQRQL